MARTWKKSSGKYAPGMRLRPYVPRNHIEQNPVDRFRRYIRRRLRPGRLRSERAAKRRVRNAWKRGRT